MSPDGLIVAGGGPGAKLVAVRDKGDHGDVAWTRDDVVPLSTSSRAGTGVGYTVAKDGETVRPLWCSTRRRPHAQQLSLPQATG